MGINPWYWPPSIWPSTDPAESRPQLIGTHVCICLAARQPTTTREPPHLVSDSTRPPQSNVCTTYVILPIDGPRQTRVATHEKALRRAKRVKGVPTPTNRSQAVCSTTSSPWAADRRPVVASVTLRREGRDGILRIRPMASWGYQSSN